MNALCGTGSPRCPAIAAHNRLAAVVVEPLVQGAAGILVCDPLDVAHVVAVVEAITRQAERFIHAQANIYTHDLLQPLAERLAELTPPGIDTSFYANSGAEIIEAAVKLAKQATGRPNVIAQHDPDARAYYQCKRSEGKRHNAAIICVAPTLLQHHLGHAQDPNPLPTNTTPTRKTPPSRLTTRQGHPP